MLTVPVVLIVFNRPHLARRTHDVIREARPEELFLVADGPRADRPEDAALCAATREMLDEVDWPCKVYRLFSEVNLGCEANVELGLDWVFSQVDRAIILEDDCIPDPTFFPYCEELLTRYVDDDRIWHIAGNSHWVPESRFGGDSYAFSTYGAGWGWATWRRSWQAHRTVFPRDHAGASLTPTTAAPVRTTSGLPRPESLVTSAGYKHYTAVAQCTDGDRYGWDSHWWITIAEAGGLCISPALNLVANDGAGEGSTHTRSSRAVTPAVPMPFPLTHPVAVALNVPVQQELELLLLRANGRLSNIVRWIIRPLWLRGIIRRIVSSPPVWRLVQWLSTAKSNRGPGHS